MRRLTHAGAVAGAAAGAVLWAYCLTVLQPAAEAGSVAAFNNTHWARDVRWAARLAVAGILVAVARGDRRLSAYTLGGLAAGIGADLVLDRTGAAAPVFLGAAAALVAGAAVVAVQTAVQTAVQAAPRPTERRWATVLAAVCAATAPVVAVIESPTDAEAALGPARLAAAVLLVVAALACAAAVSPALPAIPVVAAGAVAVGAVALAAVAPGSRVAAAMLGGGLLAAIWLLTRPWPGWGQAAGVTVAAVLGYPLVLFAGTLLAVLLPVGGLFTALAGSPAVISADSDLLYVSAGVVTGLVFVAVGRVGHRLTPTPALR